MMMDGDSRTSDDLRAPCPQARPPPGSFPLPNTAQGKAVSASPAFPARLRGRHPLSLLPALELPIAPCGGLSLRQQLGQANRDWKETKPGPAITNISRPLAPRQVAGPLDPCCPLGVGSAELRTVAIIAMPTLTLFTQLRIPLRLSFQTF